MHGVYGVLLKMFRFEIFTLRNKVEEFYTYRLPGRLNINTQYCIRSKSVERQHRGIVGILERDLIITPPQQCKTPPTASHATRSSENF